MTQYKRIASAFVWNQLARTIEYLLIFLFSLLLAKILGSHINGIYASLLSFLFLLSSISSFGFETSINSSFPKLFSSDINNAAFTFRRLLLVRFLISVVLGAVIYILKSQIIRMFNLSDFLIDYIFFIVCFFICKSVVSILNSFLISFFKTQISSSISVIFRFIELVLAFYLLTQGYDLGALIILLSISYLTQLIVLVFLLRKIIFGAFKHNNESKSIALLGIKFWVNSLMEFLLGKQAVVLLLGAFSINLSRIGNFDVAFSFAQAINVSLTIGFFGVSVSAFSAIEEKGKQALQFYWASLNRFVLLVLIPCLIFAIIFAQKIIIELYSAQFIQAVFWFQVFASTFLVTRIFGGGIAADYLQSKGMTKELLNSSLIVGVFNLLVTSLFIYLFGANGGVVGLSMSTILIALLHYYYIRPVFDAKLQIVFAIKILLISLVSAVSVLLISLIFIDINLIVSVLIYIFIFIAIARVSKPLNFDDIEIIKKINLHLANIAKNYASQKLNLTDRQIWAFSWIHQANLIVDVGCSNTPLINFLNKKANYVIGIDTDLFALRTIETQNKNLYLINSSAENVPLKNDIADIVLMLDVLEHLDNDKLAISEAWRILKPDGILILSVPFKGMFSFMDPENITKKIKRKRSVKWHKHYSYKELRRLFFRLFKIERLHYGGLFLYPISFAANNFCQKHLGLNLSKFWKKLGDLDNNISWGRLSYNVIIKLRKI